MREVGENRMGSVVGSDVRFWVSFKRCPILDKSHLESLLYGFLHPLYAKIK